MAQVEDLKILLKVKDAGGTQVIEKIQNQLRGLQRAANKASTSGIDEVARSVRSFDGSGKKNIETLRSQVTAMKALREQAIIGSTQFKVLTADINRYSAALDKAEGGRPKGGRLANLAKGAGAIAAGGVFGGPEGAIGGAAGLALGGPAGAAAGAAIGAQVGMFRQQLGALAEYSADLAKQRLALQLVTKDSDEYQRALAFISKTSKELAIPQDILTRQFTKLSASVIGAGGSVQDAETAFIGVASGIRGTGGSLQDLESALVATSQVFSKGKVSAEELRQQIGERLPGAFTLFAASLDMTPAQLDKALEKGQVSLQDFQKFAVKLFKEYGVSAQVLADSPMAAGDRLQTALKDLSSTVGSLLAPIGAAFQSTFADIANAINGAAQAFINFFGLTKAGQMERLTQRIGVTVERLTAFDERRRKLVERGVDTTVIDSQIKTFRDRLNKLTDEYYSLQKIENAIAAGQGTKPAGGLPDVDRTKTGGDGSSKRIPASQKLVELQTLLAERTGKVGKEELATLNYMIARQKILDNNLLPATDKETRLQAALAAFRNTIFGLREKETKEIEKQLEKQQQMQDSFNKEIEDRKYNLGLISDDEYNELLIKRERERLRDAYPDLSEGKREEMVQLKRQEIDPTLGEGIKQRAGQVKRELKDLVDKTNQVAGAANAIGSAFSKSFVDVLRGSKTAKEALADFFKNVAEYFLDMAEKIISKMIVMAILNTLAKVLPTGGDKNSVPQTPGSIGGASTTGIVTPEGLSPDLFRGAAKDGAYWQGGFNAFANGGIVSKPTLGLVGEGGESEYIIPASKMLGAMKRYSAGARGASVIPGGREQPGGVEGAMATGTPIDVRYTVERINEVDYVTADQFRSGMQQAAEQGARRGEQRTLANLRQNTTTRRKLGL
jgi:tape measure domain-containing protein